MEFLAGIVILGIVLAWLASSEKIFERIGNIDNVVLRYTVKAGAILITVATVLSFVAIGIMA